MFGFLLALLILDGLLLGLVVLMQAGKGDGLAAMGGSGSSMADGVLGGRQAVTLLTKTTWATGAIFLSLSLVLSVLSSRSTNVESILQNEFSSQPTPGQPLVPTTIPDAGAAGAAQGTGTAGRDTTG